MTKATKVKMVGGFGHKSMVGGVNFHSVRHYYSKAFTLPEKNSLYA